MPMAIILKKINNWLVTRMINRSMFNGVPKNDSFLVQ